MNKKIIFAFTISSMVSACATPSATLAKYSESQIQRCQDSLTTAEKQAATEKAYVYAIVPFAGPSLYQDAIIKEYERVCQARGII